MGDQGKGLIFTSGQVWKEQRSVALSLLRKFGFGKNILAERIQDEVSHYLDQLKNYDGKPVDIKRITTESAANIICSIVIGKRFFDCSEFRLRLVGQKIWGSDADIFNPDRFIDSKGQLKKPEEFIPFGVGRRACLGESMAKTELFLYLSSLIQRFHLLPVHPDQPPLLDYIHGITMISKPYQLKLFERAYT
ncbi:cytochrome P450 2J6 [Biomphalaria pfeifferi]|uniref:Cytochrome P450 2J6 n=1 Tax=Biomphalaria pfeifferi TaxID=112525 RepID=A0AAD8C1L1_BIOPF|nr:cytochrome P450 2J6 [Biomphalaria pfeifferi]